MIIKSFIIFSIIADLLGIKGISQKFSDAVVRDRTGTKRVAEASFENIALPPVVPRPVLKKSFSKPSIYAKHYLIVDENTGTILTKSAYKDRVPIASTTKIMTAMVALENYDTEEVATISSEAANQIGADAFLITGEKIKIIDLLNALLIKSGNDSAYAIAEHMNGTGETGVSKFVEKMNEKAKALGMNDTKYEDPAGLNATGYSSAYDLYLVTRYALKNEKFAQIVKKDREVVKSIDNSVWHDLRNSNRLVAEYKYPGAIGVKTGYMPEAGHCLVGAARRNGHTLISVVLNTNLDTPSASADESRKLLEWGFDAFEWK